MKLLIIGIGNPTPTFITRRLQALEKAGIRLYIVAEYRQYMGDFKNATIIRIGGDDTVKERVRLVGKVLINPFRFWKLLSIRTEIPWKSRIKWAVKYFPLICTKAPDVIHVQWLSSVPEFRWLRYFFDCPIVGSARGSQLTVYPVTRPGFKLLIKEAIEKADYIHCVSNDMALACVQFGAGPEKVFVNYNGIDLHKFQPREVKQTEKQFTIISVGAMMWRKGFMYQLQLVHKLVQERRSLQLLILGDGPDREALQYAAHILKLEQYVTFAGKIKSTELPEWLNRADAYVSTSVAEGLANSVVEAIACGLPVVAFTCEGMNEVLEAGVNGFILPVGDVDGMAEKIRHLMDHADERKKMAANARKHAVEKFDEAEWIAHMVKKYESIERK